MSIYYLVNFYGHAWWDADKIPEGDPYIYDDIEESAWNPSECVWIVPGTVKY